MPITVLMYHNIKPPAAFSESPKSVYTVASDVFESHLLEIEKAALPVLGIDEVLDGLENRRLPKRGIVLSFDDGLAGNYQYAYPELRHREWSGVFFVSTQIIDEPTGMNKRELREMSNNGMLIASHTTSHRRLENLSPPNIREELSSSKETLEIILGNPVDYLSLPGGGIPADLEMIARGCGYRLVANSVPRTMDESTSLFAVPRFCIRSDHSLDDFRRLINQDAGWLGKEYRSYIVKTGLKNFLPRFITNLRHRER